MAFLRSSSRPARERACGPPGPKPLHLICGRAMVLHVIHALELLRPERTALVVGHGAEQVTKKVQQLAPAWANVAFVEQVEQNGTGDAAAIGMTAFSGDDYDDDDSIIVVLPGDTPLLRPETLAELVEAHVANRNAATLLTSVVDDPTGYGRVIRKNNGQAPADRRAPRRHRPRNSTSTRSARASTPSAATCSGRRCASSPPTTRRASTTSPTSSSVLAEMGHRIGCVQAPADETQGVNDRWQLALAERELRSRTNRQWLLNGVTMLDPRQTFIDVTVRIGRDVTLYPGTMLQGSTVVGDECEIGPDTRLVDCSVGDGATVRAHGRHRCRGRAGRGRRAVRPSPCGFVGPRGRDDRSVLHCTHRVIRRSRSRRSGERSDSWKRSPPSGSRSTRVGHIPSSPRRSRRISTSSSVTTTSSSSPTARSGCRFGEIDPRLRRVRHPEPLRRRRALGERLDHGAPDHDRRRLPGVGEAHHRRLPVLRLRPPGPQGRRARADHRPPRRRHVQGRRRQADDLDRSALRPDPGVLRRPGRPPHGDAGARGVPARRTPRHR